MCILAGLHMLKQMAKKFCTRLASLYEDWQQMADLDLPATQLAPGCWQSSTLMH